MAHLASLLDTFLVYLEVERGFSPHTVGAYRTDCRNLIEGLPPGVASEPRRLAEKHVFDFMVSERRRGQSVASVRRAVAAVKTFCRFLAREGAIDSNPARALESPRDWKELPSVLDADEVRRLLAAVKDHPSRHPLRDRAILELAYATGLRVSEICGLRTDSLREDLGVLRCLGKGSRERIVPVSRTAAGAVKEYVTVERPRASRRSPSDILFLSRGGKPLGREVVRALIQRYARAAGLSGTVNPHTLRHSMATHLVRGGADLRVVQEILGHVKVTTTEIYTHLDRSDLKAVHKKYHPRG